MAYIKKILLIKKWCQCRFILRQAASSDPHLEHKSQQCMFQSINSSQVENTHMIFTSLNFSFFICEMEILITELSVCVCVRSVIQSCLTLCDPIDYSPPGSSPHGISQAGMLEKVAISSSRGSSRTRDKTCLASVSCIGRLVLSFFFFFFCFFFLILILIFYFKIFNSYMRSQT